MKQLFLLSSILFCFGNLSIFSQVNKIDPRQFVEISELNRQTNIKHIVFKSESIHYSILDKNSLVRIEFNLDSMSRKLNYYGNVSLVAKINNEPIKVSPYSKVGEKQGKIGINSASPSELSNYISSLNYEMVNLESSADRIINRFYFEPNDSISDSLRLSDIDYAILFFKKMNSKDIIDVKNLPQKVQYITNRLVPFSELYFILQGSNNFTVEEMLSELEKTKKSSTLKLSKEHLERKLEDFEYYKDISQTLDLSMSYLSFFQSGNEEVKGVYLRFTKQDELALDNFAKKLKKCSNQFHNLDTIEFAKFDTIKLKLFEELLFLMPLIEAFNSNTGTLLQSLGVQIPSINVNNLDTLKSKTLKTLIVSKLGEQIYQKLLVGSIDLRESRANEGDVLKISVLWYQDSDSTLLPLELELAAFDIKETGWRLKVLDSFLLVNRINNPTDEENISPSKFKGAPGVSLLYTYGNNSHTNSIFKKIEPSLGLNISYLDFDTTKDLEVGVGLVLGLLRNNIFLTFGYNLHAESKREYFGIGFSFANIANQIKK